MFWLLKQLGRSAAFHDRSLVHDRHALAMVATDSRSCEMYRMLIPNLLLSVANNCRISACVMMSSALVGSSAISSAGRCMAPWR